MRRYIKIGETYQRTGQGGSVSDEKTGKFDVDGSKDEMYRYIQDVVVDVMNLMNERMTKDIGSADATIGAQVAQLASVLCLLIGKTSDEDVDKFLNQQRELFRELASSKEYQQFFDMNEDAVKMNVEKRDEFGNVKPSETIH